MSRFLSKFSTDINANYSLWKATKSIKRPKTQDPPLKCWMGNEQETPSRSWTVLQNTCQRSLSLFHIIQPMETWPSEWKMMKTKFPVSLKKNWRTWFISMKKAPRYDLITHQVMKELSDLALLNLQYIMNASFKLKYMPQYRKIADVTRQSQNQASHLQKKYPTG